MAIFKTHKPKKLTGLWEKYYKKSDLNIKVPDISLYELIKEKALLNSYHKAYTYYGNSCTYKDFLKRIDTAAKGFSSLGVRTGDIVTVCMPNTPEGIISFYALNKIGAIANMIHPLSSMYEIKEYLNSTSSVVLVMIDLCYDKIKDILGETSVYKTIVVSAKDSMRFLMGFGYSLSMAGKIKKPKKSKEEFIYWKDFMQKGARYEKVVEAKTTKDTPAVILHSGGTTGNPKGIILSNGNFNALALQAKVVFNQVKVGDTCLTVMPIFHGFGLGVSVHCPLYLGANMVLLPKFDAKKFHKTLIANKPNVLLGVPQMYDALISKEVDMDLSYLKYIVCGGDSLSLTLTRSINNYIHKRGALVDVAQGYGMTESLAATALASPKEVNKEGSIGIPFPGDYYKICKPNSQDELGIDEEGEICVSGPTIMMGYLDNEKETNDVLQIHKDGHIWLHTGDMGYMDEDGVIFYRQRIKRMIITSGYNVYPSHIENVLEEHPAVLKCSVIGIPHKYKGEVAKAFIVLNSDYKPSGSLKKSIKEYATTHLAIYSVPVDFVFRESLPKTLIGKIDIKKLKEESDKNGI